MAKKLSKEDKLKRVQNLAKMEYTPPANVKTEGTKYDRARAILGTDKVFDGEKTYEVTNQSGQVLGTVSYDAKEAIEKNKLDSYKPKNDEEKRVIDGLVNATQSKSKENNNPVFERYNIDPNKFEFSDFLKWADEHNYKTKDLNSPDAVNYSPTNYSITPKYEGGFLGIGGKKMTTEQEDKDMEFLRKFAIEKTDNFANKTVDATLYTAKELVKNPVKTGTYLINKASAGATGVLENTIKLVEAAPDWTISKAARLVGADDFANRLEQNVKDVWDRETYAERQSKRADEEINDDKVKFVGNLVENAGALVPAIATEVATAGASPALDTQIASLVGGKTFKALSKVTNTKAGKILSNMTKPSQLVFQSGVFGSSASNAYRETGDVDKAMAYGALTAIAEGFTEQIFGGFAGTDMGGSLIDFPITNKTTRKVINMLTEGAEEVIMAYGDTGIKRITGVDKNASLPTAKEVIESGVSGILLSGLMSAATYPVNKSQTKKIANSLNVITNALNTEISDEKLKFVPLDKNASEKEIIERQGEIEDFAKEYASSLVKLLNDSKTKTISAENAGGKLNSLKEEVIKTGLESPKESEAYKNAKALSKQKNVSDYDLGKQYLLNVEQVSQETAEVKTRFAPGGATENVINLEKMLANEGVAEKNIEKIVSDAVTLESSLAKTPTTNMTAEMVERASGTITNQAKNNLAVNGAKNADYWGIYGTNLEVLSKSDKTIDEGFIDTYADAYAEGLKEGNSISYHSLAENTDNVAKTLKNYVLTGAVPETMRGTNIVEKAGGNLKGIIQSAVGSVSTAHKIVYGEGTNIARQAEAIKSGDFSSVISGESNNYKTTPSFNNAINTDEIRMVMNSTFKEGAMENIAEIMSATTGGVDMGVFAYKLAEYYQKNGNITPFRKYFTDGGIAVTKTFENMARTNQAVTAKEKTAPPKISILDMEDMESETATEDVTKNAEGKVSSEAETSETETEETEKSAKAEKEKAKTESEKDKEIKESVPEKEEEKAKDNSGKALKRLGRKGKAAYQKVLEIEQSMHSEMSEYEVLREFEKSYRAGREGVKNTEGSRLTEQSRKVAEKAGKDDRKNKSTAKENVSKKSEERVWQPKKATEKTVEKESVSETKEPKSEKSSDSRENIEVQGKGAVKWSSLHPRQQKAIVFMEGFAKAANMKLVFVANSPNFDGAYDISGDTMYLDIYAGVDPTNKLSDIIIPTASHELTHWMHYQAPVLWNKLSSAVFSALEEVDGINRADRINSEIERLKGKGLVHNELVAEDEIVARACEDMLAQSEMGKKVFESLSETEQKTITNKIKDILTNLKNWISDFLSSYKPSNRIEAEKIRQAQDKVNEILKLWNEGIEKSVEVSRADTKAEAFVGNEVYEQYGVEFDAERLSSSELGGMLYSLKYNDDIAEGQNKYLENKSAHVSKSELKKAQEVTRAMVDVMMKYSHILPEDKIGKVLTKNGSYDRSVENTTICVRTLAYNDFVDKVQEELGRPLSQMESFLVSQKMYDIATDPQCLYCYVSLDRKAFNDMLLRYIQDRDTVIAKYNNSDKSPKAIDGLYEEFLNKRKDTKEMKSRFNKWIDYADNGTQLLSLADISTEANQSDIKAKGGILAEQLTDARKYAQSASWAKIQKNYVAYRDEILRMGDRVVKNLNEHYGLRWYSFSDYSAAFIVENMQQITDASIRGLKGLAYTKDTDFVEIFAPSGMNINVSVFVNQDADGKFNIDERQSASLEKAIELRNKYPNVGIVATVTNDEALKWAAEQEWSDVIIPFHIVRTGTDVAEYYKWLNYTSESGDTIKDRNLWDAYVDSLNLKGENARKKVSKNIYPSEHNNDKATYLNLCESRGLTPRFVRFAGESWYMKLVNETRLSADESSTLKPNYNLDAARESFQKFVDKGGYEGGWYKEDIDVDAEAKAVADDVRAGKKANEVDYGRQDGFVPEDVMSSRKANRTHGANKPGMLLSEKDSDDFGGYSEEEYYDYGWARANEILNAGQNKDYRSKFADAKSGQANFNTTANGELIIPVSDVFNVSKRGINNTLVFASGTIDNPVISSIIKIDENNETVLDILRRYIYECEWRGVQSETEGVIKRYNAVDFRSVQKQKTSLSSTSDNTVDRFRKRDSQKTKSDEVNKPNLLLSEKSSPYVTEQEDADYMTAVKKGDMETAQKMVDEEAKRKGYNSPKLYHGTNSFGFTEFDLSKMDDKRTIFLTNNKRIASTYSGVSGERKISDVYNKDIEKLDIENIAKELNKFVKEYYKDTFEFANYNYSYYNLKKLNDLINVVNDGLVELTSEVEQKIAEYANKIAFDSDDANTKIYKQLVSLKERLDKWDYNNLSTPIYLLIHHTDVFADNSAKYGELEANIRLMNDLRKNEDISDGVVVEERLGRYSIEVMSKDDAVSKLKDLGQKGNYALYVKMSKPLIIDGRAQNWNNIRRWSDGLISDKKTFELADDDEFYYLKNKETGQIIKEASVDILKTSKMSSSETIDFLINKYRNILAIKYENVKTTREIAKVAKDMGYDSVVIKNITDNGGRNYNVGMEETADIYMLFDSNNVKSADPVTYDDKGNIIPLSERFNTENKDIRYSEKDTTRKKAKYLAASEKVTKTPEQIYRMQNRDIIQFIRDEYDKSEKFMPRIEDVKKSANKLGKGYTGEKNLAYEFGKLYKEVKAAIAYGERTDATEQEIKRKWDEVQNKIDDIAMDIVMNNEVKNDENWQMIKDFRKYLHGRTIKVPAEWHADFDAQGGIDGFRKHNRGRFFVSYTKGESIEALYPEMRGMFGNLLPDISNPADQLIAISDFLDEMAVTFENPYDSDIEAAAESMSLEIMADMLVNIREVGDDVRSKRIEKLHRVLQEERLKRYHALNRVKERQERKIREATEKRKASAEKKADMAARQRLLAVAKKLESLAKKSDAEKQAGIQKLIGHLDLAAVSITDKKLEKLKDIKNFYDGMKNDPDFIEDKRIEKTLERLEKKQISDLDLYDVQELTDVLLAIEHKIRTDAYAIETEDKRKISVQANETMRNIENSSGSKASGIGKFADNLIVGVLTPTREARRITGYVDNDPLYLGMKNMQSGQVDMFDYAMKAEKMFEKYTNDKKFMESITGAKAKTYTYNITEKDAKGREIGQRKIELTAGMRISLLLHNLNSSNQGHMKIGGVTIPDAKLYKAGKMQEAYARGQKIYLHPSDIKMITKDITEKEREYARVVWRYYNEFAKSEINRVSLKLKGYEIARVKNYFPIDTNKDFSKQDFELMNIDGTIEGMGFLKERIEAKNPIMLIDVASVLEKSIRMNSKYVGLAIPVRNMSLLLGKSFSEYGEATSTEKQVYGLNYTMEKGYYGSVMDTIGTKWGTNGKNYINKIMQDMQGKTNEQGPVAKVVEKIGSRYVRGILSLNLKVAFNQVASIPSAIPEVGYKALARSLFDFGRVNTDLIAEYTPLQYMRSKGAYDTTIADMARAKKGILATVDNVVDKVDLMTWTDTLMTRKLWKAATYNIKHTRSDLKEGTREFYEAVAEVYVDIMQNTQPNVSMMERPQYLRSDPVTKMLMAFKGEPFKNVNLIYESAGNLRAKARQLKQIQNNQTATSKEIAEAEERLKQANNQFVTTAVSQVVATLVYGIEASIFQLIYGKIDDYWDDEEEKVTFESWLVGVLKDSAINTVTQLPFANYVVDIIGSLNGGRYYSPYTPPALDSVDTATKSIPALVSAAQDIISGKINLQQFGFKAYDAIEDVSTFLGIPTANVIKNIKPVIKGVIKSSISNEYLREYAVLKTESAIAEKKENNKGEIVTKGSSEAFDILYRAMENGDQKAYNTIVKDLQDRGVSYTDIESAMQNRAKKDENFNLDTSLNMYAGVEERGKTEKYEKYIDSAEELGIDEELLKKVVDTANSKKKYKERKTDAEKIINNASLDFESEEFLKNIIADSYSVNDLSKEQYIEYSETRATYLQKVDNEIDSEGMSEREFRKVYNKASDLAEEYAFSQASDGEYSMRAKWMYYAVDAEEEVGMTTGEFLKVYEEYGSTIYSTPSLITHEVGYNVSDYLEFHKLTKDIKGDKDENGKDIEGRTKQDKIIEAISGMNVSDEMKAFLFSTEYKSEKNNPWEDSLRINYKVYIEEE